MSAITKIAGRGIPLRGNDIDTDRIIPARFLCCVTFDGLGEHAFADDRSQLKAAGGLHPFSDPVYAGATVLVVGSNFGCGSSREHAPQSLQKWGVRAVIGESFAEIFFNNNIAMGIPCVSLSAADIDCLQGVIEANPELTVVIDLEANTVIIADSSFAMMMPEAARQMFVRGQWDATGQLLANLTRIRLHAAQIPYLNKFL
ncbi:MAG: 3-isopropylmalate dehydratase small subunit [Desulfuromonadaceae bacterium]|nr:3-isopropylmalate dehydratase small subunit [Desulfuromonadaceae bacterium]